MIDANLQEQFRKQYNPDGSQLRIIQLNLVGILKEIDRVCKKNNIAYWIDFGTLLGAVRHGGFVPWDDDLDIGIFRKDYNKFRKCMLQELKQPYILNDYKLNRDHKIPFMRIVNRNFWVARKYDENHQPLFENAWVDVFPIDNGTLPMKYFFEATYGKCLRRVVRQLDDGKLKLIVSYLLLPLFTVLLFVSKKYCSIVHPESYVLDYGVNFKPLRIKSEILPLSEIEFEGVVFAAPANIDAYLRRFYGDYNQIPPEESRRTHKFFDIKET